MRLDEFALQARMLGLWAPQFEKYAVTRYGAKLADPSTHTAGFLAALTAANGQPVYIPAGDWSPVLDLTDLPVYLIGPGRLVHQQASTIIKVTRTFGNPVNVSSITTVTLGTTTGGAPDANLCTRLNVPSVAGFGIGTIVHLVSQDVYAFSAQQSPGSSTYMAEMMRLVGVCLEFSAEANGGFAEKNIVTGGTSGATARVVSVTDDGTTGKLLLTDINGAFQNGEPLNVTTGGVTTQRGTANGTMFLACAGTLRYPLATNVQVRSVPEVLFKVDGPELVCSGDQDSLVGTANRKPAFILLGVTNPQVKQRIRSAWTRAWQLWSCWQGDFDLLIDSLPNNADLTEQAYGYGIDWCGASFGIRARVNGGNCRHAFTTNTTWASSFNSVDFRMWGAFKGGLVYDSFISGNKAAAFDTHAGGFGLTFDNCKASAGTSAGRYLTAADGFHNRSFGTTYRNCQSDAVRAYFDESPNFASNDLVGGHKITYENCFGRYCNSGFEVAAIPNGVSYNGIQDYVGCSAVGDGSATNTPYYQYGYHIGNGVEANYVACRSASFNGAPWGCEGFGKMSLLGGCYADYTNAPAFASPLRINGNSQTLNVDGYVVRYNTATSTPTELLRVASSVTVAPNINIGAIACLNSDVPKLLVDNSGLGVEPIYRGTTNGAQRVKTRGDVAVTLAVRTDARTQVWNTPLTANRVVALSTSHANNGDSFTIIRNSAATGAFTLDVGGLKSLAVGQGCDVRFDGAAWFLERFWSL